MGSLPGLDEREAVSAVSSLVAGVHTTSTSFITEPD
jgi:hypothetical protein